LTGEELVRAPLLAVDRLTTVFDLPSGPLRAVDEVSFDIHPGETVALVGESGCGKSLTGLSIMGLVRAPGRIAGGRVLFRGRDLLTLDERAMRAVRGAEIAMIFQEPSTALNPVFTVGDQIADALRVHGRGGRREAKARAIELLKEVQIAQPAARADDYPHQLSGGMRQRVLIAMAIACRPALVIADEPTAALDRTVQARVLDLLQEMKSRFGLSLLLIAHDLAVVAQMADRVLVMYSGRIVEHGPIQSILRNPQHPYTRGLLSAQRLESSSRLPPADRSVRSAVLSSSACVFYPRCPDRFEPCSVHAPSDLVVGSDHGARCHLFDSRWRGEQAPTRETGEGTRDDGAR
jgi:oligopeptide/dipeptide ABC transporter ATP-binding protein